MNARVGQLCRPVGRTATQLSLSAQLEVSNASSKFGRPRCLAEREWRATLDYGIGFSERWHVGATVCGTIRSRPSGATRG